ncbi:MAG: 2-amino-4-hydroxy-6-hydroxymethyldihydropteridine diphosphokinase, partial [Anaerolineae bacterium]|nr:2-amino-4-hydroxy-6-hydroxymethyldihydropteridine diphosphokinase [Anaerolineae bacterium]
MNRVFVLLSSNDEAEKNLRASLLLLREKTVIEAVSSVYESAPIGERYSANFLDAVVQLQTPFSPLELREGILAPIEQHLGRERPKSGIQVITIDLD